MDTVKTSVPLYFLKASDFFLKYLVLVHIFCLIMPVPMAWFFSLSILTKKRLKLAMLTDT